MTVDREIVNLQRRVDLLEQREPPLAAEFVTTATTPADDLLVVAAGWDDGEHTFGPVRWSPIGGVLPQAGDECVIVERDDGVWQVVGWWSDSQSTGVAQAAIDDLQDSVDALDTRLDAVEAALNGKKVRSGTATVTFSTAQTSAATNVAHGLGTTPASVVCTSQNVALMITADTYGGTTFRATGYYVPGTLNSTFTFAWIATT